MRVKAGLWMALLAAVAIARVQDAAAQPLPRGDVPRELAPWVDWVLLDEPDHVCPAVNGEAVCLWPGALRLELSAAGGSFQQQVLSDREIDVPLPGSSEHWPAQVRVGGRPAAVLQSGGRPLLRLGPGTHRVQGRFQWPALPEVLQIPQSTALVRLAVEGKPVEFPRRDEGGKLWLKKNERGQSQGEQISLSVHRRIDDGVPVFVTTRLLLRAGGQAREVELGRAVLEGTVPMQLKSELPARLERDGNLFVQVQAGTYAIEVVARTESSPAELVAPKRPAPWPEREIWVWAAEQSVRQATISGPANIDPKRTDLDPEWHSLPAYLLGPGERMRITTARRGQPDTPPNQLQLTREIWLDQDGRGYTVRDTLHGALHKGYRLDLLAGELGHVASAGVDQLITRAPNSGKPGVELRETRLNLVAEWRNQKALGDLPAVGWSEDVQQLSAALHLPPGWSLFSARGVDEVQTWLSSWDLFGFFFVLLVSLAVMKLVGPRWGLLALFTLAICYHEAEAPLGIWFFLLAAVALLRVVPQGRLRLMMGAVFAGSVIALLLIAVPFAVQQIRAGLYPQLEQAYSGPGPGMVRRQAAPLATEVDEYTADGEMEERKVAEQVLDQVEEGTTMSVQQAPAPAPAVENARLRRSKTAAGAGSRTATGKGWLQDLTSDSYRGYPRGKDEMQQDPHAVVQTGPGVPDWSWKQVPMSWSGPVARDHRIRLWLLPPAVNRLLSFLRVILLALLAAGLLRSVRRAPRAPAPGG